MSKEDMLEFTGVVTDVLRGMMFKVDLRIGENVHQTTCTLSGKLKTNNIRVLAGDTVTVLVSPYDITKGRIVWRFK